jgi:hypothetical protein
MMPTPDRERFNVSELFKATVNRLTELVQDKDPTIAGKAVTLVLDHADKLLFAEGKAHQAAERDPDA